MPDTTTGTQAGPLADIEKHDNGDGTFALAVYTVNAGGGGGGSATDVTIHDPTVTTQKLAIDAAGKIGVNALPALPAGTNVIGHVIVDSAGAVTITSLPSLPAGSALIGHVVADAGSTTAVTSLPSLPAGTAVIGHVIVDSAGAVAITSLPALPAGANVIGHVIADSGSTTAITGTVAVTGTFWQATQPVSAASLPLPTGAATSANQSTAQTSLNTLVTNSPTLSSGRVPVDGSGVNQPVTLAGANYFTDTILQNAAGGTGNGTPVVVTGMGAVGFQVTGTFSATITWEGSVDGGTTYNALAVTDQATGAQVLTTTAAGWFRRTAAGFTHMRARISGWVSGTVTVTGHAVTDGMAGQIPMALYGKSTNPGDVALKLDANGRVPLVALGNLSSILVTANSPAGVSVEGTATAFPLAVVPYLAEGTGNLLATRTPKVFKTATATASGNTAVWAPAAGKKFRVLRYRIEVTNDAATSGGAEIDIDLQDATTSIGCTHSLYVPASGGTSLGMVATGWIDLGNGVLSAAANQVLNVNLSAALTAGKVRVLVIGTEE